jgi:hypothetical protein
MKVKVESCWAGNSNFYFRLTVPDGTRYRLEGGTWNRRLAGEARTLVARGNASVRKNVRFVHA